MPIDTHHAQYDSSLAAWLRSRDVVSGEDAVKAKGTTYLPKLSGQTDAEYQAYKLRASFFNGTGRTVDGLAGLIFRKDPMTVVPEAMMEILDDIDLAGRSLDEFARRVVSDALVVGRGGILAEYPRAEIRDRTADQVASENLRPYLTWWPAEKILDWRVGRVANKVALTMVKLHETIDTPDPSDRWKVIQVERIRLLEIIEGGVVASLYSKATGDWVLVESFPLVTRGAPTREIPFVFVGPTDSAPQVEKAPITDLVTTNLSHYRSSADYENGLHWTGVPTPVFIGALLSPDGQAVTTVKLGSSEGIQLAEGGDAKFLEFQGEGLEGGLGKALERKENYMAVLGARLLASEKRQTEAAETATIHRAGENSVLSALAGSVSKSITRALGIMADWQGISGEISFALCTDYLPTPLDPQALTALVAAWQAGAISQAELFEALVAGEVIRSDKDAGDHEAEIEAEDSRRAEEAASKLAETASLLAAKSKAPPANDGSK